jgi:phosphatidylglycerol:prolipoprotein diacylglycerol transferase
MLMYPAFDPIALQIGPVAIRWYGLAYVAALLLGLAYAKRLARKFPAPGITADTFENLFLGVALGVILGGRMGYVLFYAPDAFFADPLEIVKVWHGGMSFHGGMLGVIVAICWHAWRHKISLPLLADRVVPAVPIGLFFGRVANFINGELVGRPADPTLPWSMIFPHIDMIPRHPSQLYEAGLEGVLLFGLLWFTTRKRMVPYLPSGVFLLGYGLCRFLVEHFRTPEIVHSWAGLDITQGQLLSLPMIVAGLGLMVWAYRKDN